MNRVLFIGEINVDIIMGGLEAFPVLDREVACSSYEVTIGSSTAICACAYASLGGDTSFMGLAGNDENGEFMVRGMQNFGIKTDLVKRTDEIRTGVTVNLIFGKTRTQVTYPGTIAAFNRSHLDFEAIRSFQHIHLGGPYMQTAFLGEITEVLSHARKHGLSTSLDPQWDSSETWRYLDEWLPLLSFFFPNRDEALSITGAADLAGALRDLAGRTACPVIKDGGNGAHCLVEGRVVEVAGYVVEVVDTTGAGDSFDAGFIYSRLERGSGLVESVRFANAVAARSCRFPGGVNARSSCDDILHFKQGDER